MKHGALASEAGSIEVEWTHEPANNVLHFAWTESGSPVVAGPPTQKGFGTRLLEALFDEQSFDYLPNGMRFKGAMQLFK
jgi:two-component sensor histidine kinase